LPSVLLPVPSLPPERLEQLRARQARMEEQDARNELAKAARNELERFSPFLSLSLSFLSRLLAS
jgi:hypothetical protein